MATVTFEAENTNISTIRTILKALGAKKIKVDENADKIAYSQQEFVEMLESSKKSKSAVKAKNKEELHSIFNNF